MVAYTKTLPQRTDNARVETEQTEHSVFTWDPVGAQWIHERGPEMTSPPVPPDVHAIQTYFFDPDFKEWIATVLAPRGRELAAQWEGAHKVPDQAAPASAPTKKGASPATRTPSPATKSGPPVPLFAIVLVLLIVGGGAAAVVAGTQSAPNPVPGAASNPATSANPSGTPGVVPSQGTATPVGATPAATQPPSGTAVVTRTPVPTVAPTAPPPVGTAVTLADGSVVTFNGPSRVNIGAGFTVTFTVRTASNAPGTGTFLVSFGNASTGGAKTSSGTLDPSGRFVMNMIGVSLPGNYPFVVNYKGLQGQVTVLRVG